MAQATLITGILAILGAFIYAIGDVLLLAVKASLDDHPRLQAHAKLLSGSEKMAVLSPNRILWGGLLGVFATPLVLAGFWLVYQGLAPAGAAALPPVLLFTIGSVIGCFVHGSFMYLAEYIQALERVSEDSQPVLVEMLKRHRLIMIITYGFVLACILAASLWFSVLVLGGQTRFPGWMAAVNPLTLTLTWLALKRILPRFIQDVTAGAGFNIAYLVFFLLATFTLVGISE
jgi:hypothetical protein